MLTLTRKALTLLAFSFFLLASGPAVANEKSANVDDYFTISSWEMEVIDEERESFIGNLELSQDDQVNSSQADQLNDIDLKTIINLGKELWKIVEDNRPVVNVETDKATALPKGVTGWRSLTGWDIPRSKVYRIRYKNAYGMSVVNFAFRIVYVTGGSYKGQGKYISRATILPAHLDVAWGYTFNASVTVPSVLNMGTEDNPIGAAELEIKWSVDTVVKHNRMSANYFVTGDGKFTDLTHGRD